MPLLSYPASDVDVSGLAVDVELPIDWLARELGDTEVVPTGPGRCVARLSRSGSEIVVRGHVKASVTTPCARCLRAAPVDVDGELALLLRPAPRAEAAPRGSAREQVPAGKGARGREPEYEFATGEADFDTYDGETIVLDPFVREAILLEMPNFPLCSEACPGIGPAPSPDDADVATPAGVDPRLAPLGALRDRLGQPARRPSDRPLAPKKKTKKE